MRITLVDTMSNGTVVTLFNEDALKKLTAPDDDDPAVSMDRFRPDLPDGVWKRSLTVEVDKLPDSPGKTAYFSFLYGAQPMNTKEGMEWAWAQLSEKNRAVYERVAELIKEGGPTFLAPPPKPEESRG